MIDIVAHVCQTIHNTSNASETQSHYKHNFRVDWIAPPAELLGLLKLTVMTSLLALRRT